MAKIIITSLLVALITLPAMAHRHAGSAKIPERVDLGPEHKISIGNKIVRTNTSANSSAEIIWSLQAILPNYEISGFLCVESERDVAHIHWVSMFYLAFLLWVYFQRIRYLGNMSRNHCRALQI